MGTVLVGTHFWEIIRCPPEPSPWADWNTMGTININKKGISAAVIKNTAVILMLFNHASIIILPKLGIYSGFWNEFHWYLSRPAFLIFSYMIGEGMRQTHNKKKYLLRLGLFAIISELPFDYCFTGCWTPTESNVFFTLFLGALAIYFIELFKDHNPDKPALVILVGILISAAFCAIAQAINSDYALFGVALIIGLWLCKNNTKKMLITAFLTIIAMYPISNYSYYIFNFGLDFFWQIFNATFIEMQCLWAFVLIANYNGEKGKQLPKMFYYWFYPAHLIILYIISIL